MPSPFCELETKPLPEPTSSSTLTMRHPRVISRQLGGNLGKGFIKPPLFVSPCFMHGDLDPQIGLRPRLLLLLIL